MTDAAALRAMDRLRAEIALLRDRLGDAARLLEERSQGVLLAETPLADHEYRLARRAYDRVQERLAELEVELGGLMLEHQGVSQVAGPGRRAG
jgi:hypothetical protein